MSNQFLPKWACEKLSKMGCVSESWILIPENGLISYEEVSPDNFSMTDCYTPFHPYDFIGTSEQARKNAEILWGNKLNFCDADGSLITSIGTVDCGCNALLQGIKYDILRHACIDSKDAVEYICGFLEEDK